MAKKEQPKADTNKKLKKVEPKNYPEGLLQECIDHQKNSDTWISTLRDTWDEKESMLIGQLEDQLSKKTKNKIFDHRLSTIVFERAARVMAQNPRGKAFAVSKDDIGKNILMNLLINYFMKNANEQYSYLIKLRMLDLYSLVYGSMFALVPWRVNLKNGYMGPELLILPIRDCFPQPGIHNLDEADWFTVRNVSSIDWLKSQDPKVWDMDAIEKLELELKAEKDAGDTKQSTDGNKTSYVERTMYPSSKSGDVVYPRVETFTEYRGNMWITFCPQRIDKDTSKPYILRVVENPYPDQMLPIVAKHAFPLIDSPIGMGEFERGKTLQFAINSLINLYMDGVKYSIFPPLAINPDNVVPSSIKWGAGERWFMNQPNQDVQPVNLSPRGLDTFNSTYGFLLSALMSQSGTSETTQSQQVENSLGKTPQAIRLQAVREGARDEWDRFMMEETIKDIMKRWIALTTSKLEVGISVRLFKDEIEEIQKQYPDVAEVFDSKERGQVKVSKKQIGNTQYDYELETGSTTKPNLEGEQNNLTSILKAVIENPAIVDALATKNKQVDVGELFKRWMQAGGIKDTDKIITDIPVDKMGTTQVQPNMTPEMATTTQPGQVPPEVAAAVAAATGGGAPMPQPVVADAAPVTEVPAQVAVPTGPSASFKDPEIAALAAKIMGGTAGIPPAN